MSATAPVAPVVRKNGIRVEACLTPLAFPLLILAVWAALASWLPFAVASPWEAVHAILEGARRGWVQRALQETLTATAAAFVLATVAGVGFSLVVGLNRFWADVWEPILVWIYSIPKVVLYPVVILTFGISLKASIAFAFISAVFPVAIITFGAVRAIPPILLKVAASYRLSPWKVFFEIVLPVAAPSIATATRYSFCLSFLGVIVGEMLGTRQGMGQELFKAIALNDIERIFGIALVLSLIALVINAGLLVVERRVARNAKRS